MRICILSMQRIINMGSVLQAYGLKCTLEELGHEVDFIDIEPNENDNRLLRLENTSPPNYGDGLKRNKINKYLFYKLLHKIQFIKQKKKIMNFMNDELHLSSLSNKATYDYCVIGSDEVFSCMNPWAPWGFTSQLFGNVSQANKVITYAASCGVTRIDDVPNGVKEKIRESFLRISAFSVRDNNTYRFVKELTNAPICKNLDPVLITDFSRFIDGNRLPFLPEHYCAVYAYGNRFTNPKEIKSIKEYCKKRHLEIVSIGYAQEWIPSYITLSPFQIFSVMSNADVVITDTFHGTIFSAKCSKSFGIVIRNSNRNKLTDLITTLNIENHVIKNWNMLSEILEQRNDIDRINQLIRVERKKTIDYFMNSIN